jgi:hypothetical protein
MIRLSTLFCFLFILSKSGFGQQQNDSVFLKSGVVITGKIVFEDISYYLVKQDSAKTPIKIEKQYIEKTTYYTPLNLTEIRDSINKNRLAFYSAYDSIDTQNELKKINLRINSASKKIHSGAAIGATSAALMILGGAISGIGFSSNKYNIGFAGIGIASAGVVLLFPSFILISSGANRLHK